MMNRIHNRASLPAALLCGITLAATLTACEEKKAPPPPPPKAVAPPVADLVDVEALIKAGSFDARIQFPKESAPRDPQVARDVLTIANAIAKGDSEALKSVLDPVLGQPVLEELLASGGWDDATKTIEVVRVVRMTQIPTTTDKANSAEVQFAVQDREGAYLLAFAASNASGKLLWVGSPVPNVEKKRASEFDGGMDAPAIEIPAGDKSAEKKPAETKPGEPANSSGGGGKPGVSGG